MVRVSLREPCYTKHIKLMSEWHYLLPYQGILILLYIFFLFYIYIYIYIYPRTYGKEIIVCELYKIFIILLPINNNCYHLTIEFPSSPYPYMDTQCVYTSVHIPMGHSKNKNWNLTGLCPHWHSSSLQLQPSSSTSPQLSLGVFRRIYQMSSNNFFCTVLFLL